MMIRIGRHPDDGLPIYAIRSPFGPYLQFGDATDTTPTPRGCWLPCGWDITDISLETALQLLAFPKNLGPHPVTGVDVVVHLERIGAAIRSETIIGGIQRHCVTKLEPQDDVLTVTLDQAVTLLDRVGNR
jgi:DNA topoisomerase I